jgi:predicted aconitase with swiveling domain
LAPWNSFTYNTLFFCFYSIIFTGPFTQAGVGVNPGAICVGSFDNIVAPNPAILVDGTPFPVSFGSLNANFPAGDNTWDYVLTDPDAEANQVISEGCPGTGFKVSPRGKVAVIRFGYGSCGSAVRCNAAAAAGATACITYAPDETALRIAGSALIPSASIPSNAGRAIVAAFKAGKPATIVFNPSKQQNFPIATGGTTSDFSSLGLDPELYIKPDLTGIGGQVLSTISTLGGRSPYGLLSGTSMSAPYVAGAIALLVEAKKDIKFAEVKSRLVNNAQPAKLYRTELIDSVTKQGGGLVNIMNSINAKTVVYPSSLSLNDTERTQQHYTLTLTNEYTVPVVYTLSSFGAAQVNPWRAGEDMTLDPTTGLTYTPDYATVTFRGMSTRSFRVQPGQTARANVDIEPPTNSNANLWPVFSGYISVTNDQDDQIIRVPYAGMKGKWADTPIWVRRSPLLQAGLAADPVYRSLGFRPQSNPSVGAYLLDGNFTAVPAGSTLINGRNDLLFTIPAATTTRGFKVEVRYVGGDRKTREAVERLGAKPDGGKPIAIPFVYSVVSTPTGLGIQPAGALYGAYIQRNAPRSGQSVRAPTVWYWDMQVFPNTTSTEPVYLPPGEYQIKFSGQKHFRRVGTIDANFDIFSTATFKIADA